MCRTDFRVSFYPFFYVEKTSQDLKKGVRISNAPNKFKEFTIITMTCFIPINGYISVVKFH